MCLRREAETIIETRIVTETDISTMNVEERNIDMTEDATTTTTIETIEVGNTMTTALHLGTGTKEHTVYPAITTVLQHGLAHIAIKWIAMYISLTITLSMMLTEEVILIGKTMIGYSRQTYLHF